MYAKDYLMQLKNYKADIKRIKNRLKELEESMTSVGGMRYDKPNVQRSPVNAMEENMTRYLDTKSRLEKKIIDYNDKYMLVLGQINGIENVLYREILKEYFLEDRRIRQIADRMGYAEYYIRNCFYRGLKAFQKKYAEELR